MHVYNLGTVSWEESQLYYHALAYLGRTGLFLLQPASPYVCLGFHQDARKEVDLEYVEQTQLPLFRREVGGGAVFLDRGQLFYQFVFHKDDPALPASKDAFYRKYLAPAVQTFRDFGLDASFKPVNDIMVNGRKISGNGAAEIGEGVVLVGNFMMDFNYDQMTRVLRVPDEKFRDKIHKSLQENLTTMNRELGAPPPMDVIARRLLANAEELVGGWEPAEIDDEIRDKANELWATLGTPEWTFFNDARRYSGREVKIAEGVTVVQKAVKLPGGLVHLTADKRDGRIHGVHLSGDFFIFPQGAVPELEAALEGAEFDMTALTETIASFFQAHAIDAPGIAPEALAGAIVG